jgi:formylglycine-generating enzyme required for sulfatase activity
VSQSAITQQDSYPGLTITGTVGATYPIQYVNAVSNVNSTWITLTNLVLPSSPYLFLDTSAPNVQKRFYRETNVTFTARKYVGLTITGTVGSTNRIQYTEATGNTNVWRPLATNVLAASPSQFFDILSPAGAMRLYRVQDLARVPQITSASSTFALVGQPFSYQITVDSDLAITNYDASLLPAGLNINNSTGLISGTPTQEGTNNVTLTARNSSGPGTQSLSLRVRSTLATELVSIPAGSFTMGSPTTEVGHTVFEEPQTQVTFSHAFSIGKYEVSQAEYQAVVGANPSLFPGDLNRPIDNISWQDATNFCALLTARDRLSGRISATSVYRLPTEAEWEYVARAGTSTAYTFGDDAANLGQYAWFTDNSGTMPHPTGQKLANPWGVYDMYGNTWEFCSDWFGNYPGGSVTDPQGAATGTRKIVRGGSWFRSPESLRSGKRAVLPPEGHNGDVGFRIVLFTP